MKKLSILLVIFCFWAGSLQAQQPYGDNSSNLAGGEITTSTLATQSGTPAPRPGSGDEALPTTPRPGPGRSRPGLFTSPALSAPPAWAQDPAGHLGANLEPFGANLFQGHFSQSYYSGLDDQYRITPGDRVAVHIWGAKSFDDIIPVDQQGNIFLPEIGPVAVGGITQSRLLSTVKAKLATVFTSQVDIYVNLLNAQPVAVYVTGFVNEPGRYAGGPTDPPLYYLDMAGGVNTDQGSYRRIRIKRGDRVLANLDLYDFILQGSLPNLRLQDGDVIVVEKRGLTVSAIGRLPQPAIYEMRAANSTKGEELIKVASPLNSVSHVSVSGARNETPFNAYMTLAEFREFTLNDNDQVEFHSDRRGDTIMVALMGAAASGSRYTVRQGTTLTELLRYIPVDEEQADWSSVYLRRLSVAEQQKKSIEDALRRLEHSALTATSSSVSEAEIRIREAQLVQDFAKRAAMVQPDGVVVVSRRDRIADLTLEDGDAIVIPLKTNVVLISGEVMMPKALVYSDEMSIKDYVAGAGGFTDRADPGNILSIKPNGEIGLAKILGVEPGDRLMVMPAYDSKDMQVFKDITQIMYQIAIAAGVVIGL